MKNYNVTLKDFLDYPYEATLKGYQPSIVDCWCFLSTCFNRKMIKDLLKQTKDILHCEVKEAPLELLRILILWGFVLTIPLGGWFIFGTLGYLATWSPKKIEEQLKQYDKVEKALRLDL